MPNANYLLFDPPDVSGLLPLAFTRAVADFRVGIFTVREKWEHFLDKSVDVVTRPYLQPLYGPHREAGVRNRYINASVLPDAALAEAVMALDTGEALCSEDLVIAYCSGHFSRDLHEVCDGRQGCREIAYPGTVSVLRRCWDLFGLNRQEILRDLEHTGLEANGAIAGAALAVRRPDRVFIDEGAQVDCAIINASDGPVYIGKNAHIMDGAVLQGPLAICDNAVIKMGARLYADTTIGPYCKVGGEVSNSVIFGYSNKGHDGYLGNSVLGEWCNLGADTNTSNLKNNYSPVKCWDYAIGDYGHTGLQFCGLIMGDHSKSAINTMFNTGTVAGVACNIYGGGFPPKFLPSFSWGGAEGLSEFQIERAFEMAARMMERRGQVFTEHHKTVLQEVWNQTRKYRRHSTPNL